MTNKEILKRAIEKALKNEFNSPSTIGALMDYFWTSPSIIFSHSFAKAFWGEEYPHNSKITAANLPYWKLQLTQLVMHDNPLEYIKTFL